MNVQIATPEKIVFRGTAHDVLVNGDRGQLNILDRHADLVTFVRAGSVTLHGTDQGGDKNFQVSDGVLKVESGDVILLCPTATAA